MKNWLAGWCCLLLAGAALATGPAGVRKRVQASMLLTGTIVVAPDGSVRSYAIDHVEKVVPAAMTLINRDVPSWRFQPVLHDGKPAEVKAWMSLRVVAHPIGDEKFALDINGSYFVVDAPGEQFSSGENEPPRYPEAAVRTRMPGTVYLVLRVDQQGRVEDAAVEQVNLGALASDRVLTKRRGEFARSALVAARKWTFHVPAAGNDRGDVEWLVRVPVVYRLLEVGEPEVDQYGKWQMYVPGPKEAVPWLDDQGLLSDSADALPGDGVYHLDPGGLHRIAPPSGA
ncbi:energy transducer TonB [Rhodanobacter sp. Root561]|uniref:energy transducer TonB n=1 Tax=Rhodanobacter sp. Root561 TaxID=1736560 RepID=UPI0006F940D5|nr:energy transducer TonB [Rhodanobacter sp. Root561]KQZ79673.1 energy transducer TonB [Rhodanobacter sp. Root561]